MQDESGQIAPVAAITGGAGGIGRACAVTLMREGYRVILLDHDEDALDMACGETGATAMALDVADPQAVGRVFAKIDQAGEGLDLLVNNAGIAIRGPTLDCRPQDWDRVIAVNLTGSFLCAQAAGRIMIPRKGGNIVNVASIMGLSGGLYANLSYQASKGGMVNLTRALAAEWACHGIRVNAVAPTWVDTDLIAPLKADPGFVERVGLFTPMRRLASPGDVAEAVAFLAGPRAAMTTGHVLPVDGGFLAI
ncbi:NAD(P)-dependent dehydrogenase, short-chain alcohol dehydrogenase family [Paracoccus thiocyanatus]|uniref:NAD(P)-dependent dehydrogenase, short-chain alcohol dehydrogenase family n=1 Tax=Paracoccus thiocyanatus TaxID=34006 RepID=A0A1N6PV31_9RHOB|nr:SDR family oxidoreductase [Paracoccus thiocyanatus]SIQ08142.1 NAD(P)-dependent dehydrogenase, short-chain alcohol dehydrogenase family [Paracoccus thiocyanatus]